MIIQSLSNFQLCFASLYLYRTDRISLKSLSFVHFGKMRHKTPPDHTFDFLYLDSFFSLNLNYPNIHHERYFYEGNSALSSILQFISNYCSNQIFLTRNWSRLAPIAQMEMNNNPNHKYFFCWASKVILEPFGQEWF